MRIRRTIGRPEKLTYSAGFILLAISSYFALSWWQHHSVHFQLLSIVVEHEGNPDDTTIPNFHQLQVGWGKIWEVDAGDGTRWITQDLWATFSRHLIGLTGGVLLSIVVGMAMGCFARVEAALRPILSFLAKIPPTAMLAVFFVLVGTDENLYYSMIMFGVFPTLAQSIFQSSKYDVPLNDIHMGYIQGCSTPEVIWNVVFKEILPRILEAVRLCIGPAMVFLIAAEWMMSDVGFGYRLRIQSRLLNMNVVYIYLCILGLTCYLMDTLVSLLRRKMCPWFQD